MNYNFENLKNYALWYYFRYFPSSKKLLEKLNEKAKDEELPKKVFDNISHLINDKQVAGDKVRLYLLKNKNLKYIKGKLFEKGFEKELIGDILENDFLEEGKSLLQSKSLFIKIENYKNAGKSIQYVKQKFIERPEDKDIVEKIIEEVFYDGEDENLQKELEKLQNKGFEKQKIVQKLLQKGFYYNEVKKYI